MLQRAERFSLAGRVQPIGPMLRAGRWFMGRILHCLCIVLMVAAVHCGTVSAQSLTDDERALLSLLDKAGSNIPAIVKIMERAGAEETVRLGNSEQALVAETSAFFHALLGMQKGTQAFQSLRGKVPDWGSRYAGVERALMLGRALIVQRVFRDTLIRFYNTNPEAIGAIYGEMDIGTWVSMKTKTLQFDKDIDLSSLALDDRLNMMFRDSFRDSLQQAIGISDPEVMIRMDALLTPHGRATPEVFICEWGRTFAEMDLLKRGKWKLIMLRLEDGSLVAPDEARRLREQGRSIRVVDIETREMSGTQFFWWRAFFENRAVEFPNVTLKTEPMLSLEMSRHLILDIERGKFAKIDKLLKVMKYLERSVTYNMKATAAYRNHWDPSDNVLARFAEELTRAKEGKNSALDIAKVLEKYQGELFPKGIEGGDLSDSESALDSLLQRSKAAIIKNAEVALAIRLREIAKIKDEKRRNLDLDTMLAQMAAELEEYKKSVGEYPEGRVKDIVWLARKLREGDKWSQDVVAQTMNDLIEALQEENYRIEKGIIDYLFSPDDARALRLYLRETLRWKDEQINAFIDGLRKRFPSLAKGYDRLHGDVRKIGKEVPTFALVHSKIKAFNDDWSQTVEGSSLLSSMDFADNALAVYDAFMSGENNGDGAYKAGGAILKIKLTGAFPSLQVAEGILQAYKEGDVGPAIKSFTFYFFPTFGAFWGLGESLARFDTFAHDREFLSHLDAMRTRMVFDPKTGHITDIKLKSGYGDVLEFRYSPDRRQRAENFADYFTKSGNLISADALPEFRFWMTLIPRAQQRYGYGSDLVDKGDEAMQQAGETWAGQKLGLGGMDVSGRKGKYFRLRRYFQTNENLLAAVLVLESSAVAPGFTDLAGPKLRKKRDDDLAGLEDKIERAMWISLFGLLEASATPPEDLKRLVERLEKLQKELSLSDTHLSDIRGHGNGLVSTVNKEIKAQLSKDYYGKFIYERYVAAYDQILRIQSDIIALWTQKYEVDWKKMISSPLKMVLDGGVRSAPRLTLDVDEDLRRAQECLNAHFARGFKVDSDLADALGHRPESPEEMKHRRYLAQLGFEIEHLFDDCGGRTIDACREELVPEITARLRQYRDYLAALKPADCTYEYSDWGPCDPVTRTQTRTLKSKTPKGCTERGAPVLQQGCVPPDAGPGKAKGSAAADVPPGGPDGSGPGGEDSYFTDAPSSLTVTAPSIWPGDVGEKGFALRREEAKGGAIYDMCPYPATVVAEASGAVDSSSVPGTLEEIRDKFERDKTEHARWGRTVEIRPFSLGGFTGFILESAQRFLPGGWSGEGYRDSGVEAFAQASLLKDGRSLHLRYNVASSGCWDNSQRPFMESQAASALAEAKSIISGIVLSEKPGLKHVPYAGPKLDGSDLPKVTLSPPSLERLKVGDRVTVTADVQNAKAEDAPYAYAWAGTFDGRPEDSRSSPSVTIAPTGPGKFDLSVTVEGARFPLGSAGLQYEVADYKATAWRVQPDSGPVPAGGAAEFAAALTVDGQPAQGSFIYRWQPHPEVAFDKLEADSPGVRATFSRPGTTRVWVQVLERRDGREATVAESEQIDVEVVAPRLVLSFEPPEPMVGQDVRARLTVEPQSADIDLRWVPLAFNARQTGASPDGREVAFFILDERPVNITVMARVPGAGDGLGMAQGSLTARKYAVQVSGPKATGPRPRVWKEGVGLVEAEGAFAVGQAVEFAAETAPPAQSGPVSYAWKVAAGACTIGNPTSREVRVTAFEAGTCDLSVTVRDRNGVELGSGTAGFTASQVSAPAAKGQKKSSDAEATSRQIAALMQTARDKAARGDYDGAVRDAEAAVSLDPARSEASALAKDLRAGKQRLDARLDAARAFMGQNRLAEARRELAAAKALNPAYGPVLNLEHELGERERAQTGARPGGAGPAASSGVNQTVAVSPQAGSQGPGSPGGDMDVGASGRPPAQGASALVGMWTMDANGYAGKIEFVRSGSLYMGRLRLDHHGQWETLEDVRFDGREVRFTRPIPELTQRYVGILSGEQCAGTFDQAGAGSWNWTMRKEAATPFAVHGCRNVAGAWNIAQGPLTGVLRLDQAGEVLSGFLNWEGHADGTVESGLCREGRVEFTVVYPGGMRGAYAASIDDGCTVLFDGSTTSGSGDTAAWSASRGGNGP